ncbi:MAG: FAD-dependent oxidoreductase [Pseudomonadota bacterium]
MTRIAIIGSGISGLGAAYALKDTSDVTVFEARERAGGHAHTVDIDYDGRPLSVDVGFIVYNGLNYPNITGLFNALGVATQDSDMSFAVSDPNGWEWASNVRGIFAQRRNLLSPRFHRFWRGILAFNDLARHQLTHGEVGDVTLATWLNQNSIHDDVRENYILPMAAAIWSTPEGGVSDFPARSFFEFFENHRLMHKERPTWRTVTGGSRQYVQAIESVLGARLRTSTPVAQVSPFGDKVRVDLKGGKSEVFDHVIMATHSDQTKELLDPAFDEQRFLLGSARYRPNRIYLHRDPSLMPTKKAAWASWNVMKQGGEDICLTYWMNLLQDLPRQHPLFVTLNPERLPREDLIDLEFTFDHPQFDAPAEAAVRSLKRMQGQSGIWFAGAWMGHGFHEDGLKSGLAPALALGGKVAWTPENVDVLTPPNAQPGVASSAGSIA